MEKILIVEDEKISALDCKEKLESAGYDVVGVAHNGETAIELTASQKPDLILMDINLKNQFDGIDTAHRILENHNLPIIYTTVYSDEATLDRAKYTNPFGYLVKPFSDEDLRVTVEMAIHKFKMEQVLIESENAFRLSEAQFKSITQSVHDLIILLDKNGTILFTNDQLEKFLGYKVNEVIGRSFTKYIPEEETPRCLAELNDLFQGIAPRTFITKVFDKNGNLRDIDSHGILVDYKDRMAVQVTIRDITERMLAENKLLESEKSYKSLFNSVTEAIYVHDENGIFIDVNEGAMKMYGYSREELIGKTPQFVSAPNKNDLEHVKNILKRVMLTGVSEAFEFWGKRKNSEIFPKEVVSNKCKYFGTDVIISTARDVTERKKAECDLHESKTKYENLAKLMRLMCDNVPDMIWAKDLNKNYLFANKAICENLLCANETDEPLGKSDLYFADRQRQANPDKPDWHTFGEICVDSDSIVMNEKKTGRFEEFGNVKGKHLVLDVFKTPFVDEKGEIIGTVGSARDITEEKAIQAKLAESEERYRNFMQLSLICVYAFDARSKKIIDSNFAFRETLGYSIDELSQLTIYDFIFHDRLNIDEMIDKILKVGPVNIGERNWRRKDGQLIPMLVTATRMLVNGKDLIFVAANNITERKKIEKEINEKNDLLEKINLEKDKFFSIVAHDLKSPFQGFIGLTEMLAKNSDKLSKEKLKSISKEMHLSARNLYSLLKNLLEWTMVQKGEFEVELWFISLSETVRTVLTAVENTAARKGITIINQIKSDVQVYADYSLLNSILLNLVSNAVKFTNHGGEIIIDSKLLTDNQIEISVKDNGIGMSEELRNRLFRIDEKVGRIGTDNEPSTGLGLLLCKEFIEKLNGTIRVESKEGEGSVFYFTLPLKNG